jgi:hypothetical protein
MTGDGNIIKKSMALMKKAFIDEVAVFSNGGTVSDTARVLTTK